MTTKTSKADYGQGKKESKLEYKIGCKLNPELLKILSLEDLLRVLRSDAWTKGKEQRKTPRTYTLSDETLLKAVWQEVNDRYLTKQEVSAAIGEDDDFKDKAMGLQRSRKTARNELRAELRSKLSLDSTQGDGREG